MARQKSHRINSWCGWDPLEEAWVGRHYPPDYFNDIKDPKVRDPLKKIAEETEEDYQSLVSIIEDYGAKVHRPDYDKSLRWSESSLSPAVQPRDYNFVYGNTLYRFEDKTFYNNLYKMYVKDDCDVYDPYPAQTTPPSHKIEAPSLVRFGDSIMIDSHSEEQREWIKSNFNDVNLIWWDEHEGHRDGVFCPVKEGLIMSLHDYKEDPLHMKLFKGWDYVYMKNVSWENTLFKKEIRKGISQLRDSLFNTNGKFYVRGEEHNIKFIAFVNKWLKDWVGYVAESVFDINMFTLDQNHVIVNGYNKTVFDTFKKHKIEPIVCNLRHRYFWDGGLHCNTLDIRRKGSKRQILNY